MRTRWVARLGLGFLLATACGPSAGDVARWEATEPDGVERLEHLLADPAEKPDLRADAAMAMIHAVRRGRHPGVERLAEWLGRAPPAEADAILERLAPRLRSEIARERPGGDGVEDPSLPAKDLAVLLLLDGSVHGDATKTALREALLGWVHASTAARLGDRGQRTSVPQSMRLLGAPAVDHLPTLVDEDVALPELAALVRDLGDAKTKAGMTGALVARDERLASPAGAAELGRAIEAANAKSGVRPTAALVEAQLDEHRARVRGRTLEALVTLGDPRSQAHVLERAVDAREPGSARRAALDALRPVATKLVPAELERLVVVAKDEAHGDVATRVAAAELLVDAGAPHATLHALFDARTWRVRFVAAEALLASPSLDVAELVRHLPADERAPMSVVEPLVYGRALAKKPGAAALLAPLRAGRALGPKLVALAALGEGGEGAKAELVRARSDTAKVPACSDRGECAWTCQTGLGLRSGRSRVSTVGEFVEDCVLPSLGQPHPWLPPAEPTGKTR